MLLTNELCCLYVWLRVHCVKVCALLSLICVRGEKQLFHGVLIGYGANRIFDWTIMCLQTFRAK